MTDLLPLFLNLTDRPVLLVGGGAVAVSKLAQLVATGADLRVVAPDIRQEIVDSGVRIERRRFAESDLDGVWLVIAAALPEVNRAVAEAAHRRRLFVNAVDDPSNATAYLSGVVRRDGVTLAISSRGDVPGLTGLLREALDAVLPRDLRLWMDEARRQRICWRRDGVPMEARRPLLLTALNVLYERRTRAARPAGAARPVTAKAALTDATTTNPEGTWP
jgi:siroheme synthase-like protein